MPRFGASRGLLCLGGCWAIACPGCEPEAGGGQAGQGGNAIGSGGAPSGGQTLASGGAAGSTPSTGGTAAAFCSHWSKELATANQQALELHGFFESKAVLEGTLGDRFEQDGVSYARFTISRVRAGVSSYAGREIGIAMGPGLHATFGAGTSVLVGLSSTYSFRDASGTASMATWSNALAIVRADQATLPEEALGFRAWHAPNVAIVRVRELPVERIAFDVRETLAGALPPTLLANWSANWGPVPVQMGDELVAGFGEIIDLGGESLATEIVELRPSNADERARALRGIDALGPSGFATRYRAGLDQARDDAALYRLAWTFGRSEYVLGVEVAGIADECCTNAGGTYFANTVTDLLRGAAPAGPVVTGGHGVYADYGCGDRFLLALRTVATTASGTLAGYSCTGASLASASTSGIEAVLDASAASRSNVELWLRSAAPLLRLYANNVTAPADALTPPGEPAVWSVPVSTMTALRARHLLALMTILDVSEQTGGGYAVRVRTPFYRTELSHLANTEATMFFPCADPRLLEVGRRWVGALMGAEPTSTGATSFPAYLDEQRLMLIPGMLIPDEREDLVRTADLVTPVVIERPLSP